MIDRRKVLITGAAGTVGSILREHWGDRYQLRLADVRPVDSVAAHEHFVKVDITQYESLRDACQDMDTIVHLAAEGGPSAAFYDRLLTLNIIGAYNAFHAAHEAGCRRIVFTSSINAVLGYGEDGDVEWDVPVYPQNVYGASKCWGEALARVYSDRHGLSCICVRLGGPRFDQNGPWDPEGPQSEISRRDAAQLFGCCVDAQDVPFGIVYGVSRHRRGRANLAHTCQLIGYEPQDGTVFPKTG